MFTGIIEGLGTIREIRSEGQGKRMAVEADFPLEQTKIGDSICVSGACLTVVMINAKRFTVDVSPETLERTTFGNIKVGDRVNLERALVVDIAFKHAIFQGHSLLLYFPVLVIFEVLGEVYQGSSSFPDL